MTTIQHLYRLRLADAIAAGDVTPMMVFPIGEWSSAKYPSLPLTEDLANELIANFEAGVLGTEPVVDSSGRHDTSTPAAGWVKRVYLASYEEGNVTGLALWADVKWTGLGAELLADERYKYGSVEIGPVTLNDTGAEVDNVLRSLTLTNTPVLRLMPDVQNAAAKQRAVVTLALSEITLSTTEDDGDPAVPTDGSSPDRSQPAKDDEGQDVALSEDSAAPKGVDHPMKTVAIKLKLAEDADEALILAEVTKLAEHDAAETVRADAAELQLNEVAKAKRAGEVEVELAEITKVGNLTPGEKPEFVALAEEKPDVYEARVAERKALPAFTKIKLGEDGSADEGDDGSQYADASVELAEKAKARAAKDGSGYSAAEKLVLSEDPKLAERYSEFRMNIRKEA